MIVLSRVLWTRATWYDAALVVTNYKPYTFLSYLTPAYTIHHAQYKYKVHPYNQQ